MTAPHRVIVLLLLGLGIAGALALRSRRAEPVAPEPKSVRAAKLVELGSTSCKSCKAMHEELALFRQECGASITVEEIDVWRDDEEAQRYGVKLIPTQVFLDADGREIDRHVGFLARNDIRQRFAERGLECRQ